MKVFRYNAQNREDRLFNQCGEEKNPNNLAFYANNLSYADNYKNIYSEDGEFLYECALEETEISVCDLFDMDNNYNQLDTYNDYVKEKYDEIKSDYTNFLNNATTKSDVKIWKMQLAELENFENFEKETLSKLKRCEFQTLSDFDLQNKLVAELTEKGFNGYITKNETVLIK